MSEGRARKIAMVGAPLVAVATVALGLLVGAGSALRGAIVSAAPRSAKSDTLAWQIATFNDDHGVREAIAVKGLTVTARARTSGGGENAPSATWRGESNDEGIAEALLDLPSAHQGGSIWLEVRADGDATPLASGTAWPDPGALGESDDGRVSPFVRATKRDGDIVLDVAIYGVRLTAGYPTPIWVRATDRAGAPLAGVVIDAEPEPGLTLAAPRAVTCEGGFAELSGTALVHIVGISLRASASGIAGAPSRSGEFFAGLPVAAGAFEVRVPSVIAPGAAKKLDVLAPNARKIVYTEVDDDSGGRIFAAALPLTGITADAPSAIPHATIDVPPLAPGLYWLTTAGEPSGAATWTGATLSRPFTVAAASSEDRCALGSRLALARPPRFRRWIALDGFDGRNAFLGARRRRGQAIALASLAIAALIEVLLVAGGAKRAKVDLKRASIATMGRSSLVIGLLLALLGFALIASFLVYRGNG